ncbi:MAG: hypothetical protein GY714_15160 [Desulfobacterales bacterium]|nr:hypothetical protein [Desulfobacterales bacterium]MCP4162110.1 hypothetical protein [Deltaproteobacteria bacterium]
MTISIGKVTLTGIQEVYTEENRNLVEQRVPDQQGSVFQDLGREPLSIVLEGFLFGSEVLTDLENLRQAQEKVEPLPLSADIAVGTELTEVIIEDFKVRQIAGYASRYRFFMRLREYTEVPQSQAQKDASVNSAVDSDATAHTENTMAASAALENPENLAGALGENPELIDHMSTDDLTGSIANNADKLSADEFGGSLAAVGKLSPDKMEGMMTGLQEKGALGGFMEKFANAGRSLQAMLKNIDLKALAKSIVALFTVGAKLIGLLKKLWEDMKSVWNDMKKIDLKAGLEVFLNTGVEDIKTLIGSVTRLVQSLNEVVVAFNPEDKSKPSPIKAIKDLNCGPTVTKILNLIITTIQKIEGALAWIGSQIIQLGGVAALLGLMRPVLSGGFQIIENIGGQIVNIGAVNKENVNGIQDSVKGVQGSFSQILEGGKTSIDSILSIGESLLSTYLDFKIFPLKNEFGILRENLENFKLELESPQVSTNNQNTSTVNKIQKPINI